MSENRGGTLCLDGRPVYCGAFSRTQMPHHCIGLCKPNEGLVCSANKSPRLLGRPSWDTAPPEWAQAQGPQGPRAEVTSPAQVVRKPGARLSHQVRA